MPRRTIGVLSPLFGGNYFGGLLTGVQTAAHEQGSRVIAIQTRSENFGSLPIPFDLPVAMGHIDGWIVVLQAAGDELLQQLASSGKPVVSISMNLPNFNFPAVLPDNRGGSAEAVEHLIGHGHRRIAFAGNMAQQDIRERYEGYQATLQAHGIELDATLLFETNDNFADGGRSAAQAMLAAGVPFSAIFAATDRTGLGVMETLQHQGYRFPDDLALVGFDDIEEGHCAIPPLSSVRQRFTALGERAAQRIFDLLQGKPIAPDALIVATRLIPRGSCGCWAAKALAHMVAGPSAEHSWQLTTLRQAVELVLSPVPLEDEPERIWPGARKLIRAVEATLEGQELPSMVEQTSAWREAIALNADLDRLSSVMSLLERTSRGRLQQQGLAASETLDSCLEALRTDLLRAWQAYERVEREKIHAHNESNYRINMELLDTNRASSRTLEWLRWTTAHQGCLGIWTGPQEQQLELAGVFEGGRKRRPRRGKPIALPDFPPADFLKTAYRDDHDGDIVLVTPVRAVSGRSWGLLALAGAQEVTIGHGLNSIAQWAAELGAALEREELLGSLAHTRQSAEQANRMKSQFLANMSHELRTPLNAIINFTRILQTGMHGPLTENQNTYLEHVVQGGEHLLGLINDILDLSKIESGKMELFVEKLELGPLLHGVMSTAIGLTKDKGLSLTLDAPADLPRARADKTRIRQVLLNLLSNAAKFTDEGGITVRARANQDGMIQVDVVDTGLGIAPEHHAMVFEEFRQVSQPHLTQGTGLGLPICRRLVELHGGTMWMSSVEGQGSTFSFTLPPAETPVALGERRQTPPGEAGGPLIMVIDDDKSTQDMIRYYLESNGYSVTSVFDPRQAVELIRESRPSLVVLDVVMPYLDGWEILTQLRSMPETIDLPVIMCSLFDQQQIGFVLGANAHLTKPVREEQLLHSVHYWAGNPRTVLIADDNADARIVMRDVLERMGCQVLEAINGDQVLEALETNQPTPELLILDLVMPGMDGFEVIRRLRADPRWRDLPVIIVTAKDLNADEHEWLRQQAQGCMQKSQISSQEFLGYVRQLVRVES